MRSGTRPPKLAKRLFTWYCGAAQVDDLLGDMDEIYGKNLERMSRWRAKGKYWLQVFSLISSYAITKRRQRAALHPHSNDSINFHMLRNYFLIAWRMMTRNQVYTIINVLGLSLGISACIVVFLVVSHEYSFDRFHPDKERIFRVKTGDEGHPGWVCACVPAPAYTTLRDQYAGAEVITGYHNYDAKASITEKEEIKHFDRNTANIIITDPDYFRIFQYQWLAGSAAGLSKPMRAVLTESRARTYFGAMELQNMIGKEIAYNDSLIVTVAGVVKDWTYKSDFKRTEFISFSTIENSFLRSGMPMENWGVMTHSSQSVIKIRQGDSREEIADQASKVIQKNTKEKYVLQLQPISDVHFYYEEESNSNLLSSLYTLSGLAAFILIIAAINFINLSTAQSISRAREIGIRKVMGSMKRQIIFQFLSETMVLAFISLCLSLALIRPLLFLFSSYVPAGLSFDPLSVSNWMFMGGLLLLVSFLAGIYPALLMSSYLPATILSGKGVSHGRDRLSLRKMLIVFQFSVSLFFIIATLVISGQMDFIQKKDRGFSTASVVTFQTDWRGDVNKVKTLSDRLRQVSGIDGVAVQGFNPMGFAMWMSGFEYFGAKEKIQGTTSIKSGDENFIPLYQIRLIAGRNLLPSDSLYEVVINQQLSKTLGFDDPRDVIGEKITENGKALSICGVVQDFHELSFRQAIGNCLIGNFRQEQHAIALRLHDPDLLANAGVLSKVESEYKRIYPDEPFEYHFIEDEIGWMHGEEKKTSNLATIAMALTIFISCMGVFGLAMFTANMRNREIGIRKVLGASVVGIVNMLSREFMILIVVSIALATPVAWYYMNNWLLGFQYHTDLSWWSFVAAGSIALITGLLTVSFQSFKAATGDPVKALRTE